MSGNDSENEGRPKEPSETVVSVELGGLKIPANRLLDLMRVRWPCSSLLQPPVL